jgi:hypothetical protein
VLGYGLDDQGSRVRFPAGAENFSLRRVRNGSGAHPVSYPMCTRCFFPGVKRREREADHSPPSSNEVKNAWSHTSTPPYVFMAWCSVKHRDDFTFVKIGRSNISCPSTGTEDKYHVSIGHLLKMKMLMDELT